MSLSRLAARSIRGTAILAALFSLAPLSLSALQAPTQNVRVAAAADLQPVLPDLLHDFEKQSGLHVDVSYGPSGTLTTQILNGAPFDLFLSADMGYPARIAAAGLSGPPVPYARGTLVLWARKDSPVQPLTLEALSSAALRHLAVANPEHAPSRPRRLCGTQPHATHAIAAAQTRYRGKYRPGRRIRRKR